MKKLFIVFYLLAGWTVCQASAQNDAAHLRKRFQRTEQATLDFWTVPAVMDSLGYHLWFDASGRACAPRVPERGDIADAGKPLITELRVLWNHAMAIPRASSDEERYRIRRQYEHGFRFIARYLDPDTGLYRKMLTEDGRPLNSDITAISQAYVFYVMSEIGLEICDRRAVDIAVSVFRNMDRYFHDSVHGGYYETDARDVKSVGTNLHCALGFARLLELSGDGLIRKRLQEVFGILTSDRLLDPASGNGYMVMTGDWKPLQTKRPKHQQVLYGHNAELIWYTLEAARMLRIHPETMIPWLKRVSETIMKYGIYENGAAAIYGPVQGFPPPENSPRWWTQLELMNMLGRLYDVTGEEIYFSRLRKVADFIWKHLVNQDGVFYGAVDLDSGKCHPMGGWAWKSGLHVVRSMRFLDGILARAEGGWRPLRRFQPEKKLPRRAIQVSLGYRYNHDRSAASLVSEVKNLGYDAMFIILKEPEIRPVGLVAEAHRQGLQIWGSFFGPGTFMDDALFPPESVNWRMAFTVERPNRYFSYVHPEYREWWKKYLGGIYGKNKLDGFVFYESHYNTRLGRLARNAEPFFGDISEGFQKHFRRQTGHRHFPDFVNPESPEYYKTAAGLYRDYQEYRVKSVNDFYGDIWDGPGGLRRSHPEVIYGTWTIALAEPDSMAEMREGGAEDGPRMVAGLAPDFHFIQSHWPDWMKKDQRPDYIRGYLPYMKAIRDVFPGLPLAVQGDYASTVDYRRSPRWGAQMDRTAREIGFRFTTYYEFHLRHAVHYAPPRAVDGELSADGRGKIVFDQRISPESAEKLKGRVVGDGRIARVSCDGSWLLFQLDRPVKAGQVCRLDLGGVSDDPSMRVPMPKIGQGGPNVIGQKTYFELKVR